MSELGEGPGDVLKAAREALHVSEREVADALNLPLSVIEAMEANDYEQLPPAVFTRGYLRSYARLLELDADDVVASFPVTEEDNVTSLTGEVAAISTPNPLADKRVQMIAAAGVAVVLLIIVVVTLSSSPDEAATQEPVAAGRVSESVDTPEPGAVDQQTQTTVNPAQETSGESFTEASSGSFTEDSADSTPSSALRADRTTTPALDTDLESVSERDIEPGNEAAQTSAAAATALVESEIEIESPVEVVDESAPESATAEVITDPTPAGMRRITPFGDDVLTMTFSEDCWVDIKDRDGAQLYGDLIRGGRTIALIGDAPFRILLGYAPGALVSFNGEPLDVESRTRNNVARLTVGN